MTMIEDSIFTAVFVAWRLYDKLHPWWTLAVDWHLDKALVGFLVLAFLGWITSLPAPGERNFYD